LRTSRMRCCTREREDLHQDRRPAARRDETRVCRTCGLTGALCEYRSSLPNVSKFCRGGLQQGAGRRLVRHERFVRRRPPRSRSRRGASPPAGLRACASLVRRRASAKEVGSSPAAGSNFLLGTDGVRARSKPQARRAATICGTTSPGITATPVRRRRSAADAAPARNERIARRRPPALETPTGSRPRLR
jgi:hypothetical protein